VVGKKGGRITGEAGWREFAARASEDGLLKSLEWLEGWEERKAA
jgi:hypothetical protein